MENCLTPALFLPALTNSFGSRLVTSFFYACPPVEDKKNDGLGFRVANP